jgi:hypothetical protein
MMNTSSSARTAAAANEEHELTDNPLRAPHDGATSAKEIATTNEAAACRARTPPRRRRARRAAYKSSIWPQRT